MSEHTQTPWRSHLHHTKVLGGRSFAFVTSDTDLVPIAAVTLGVEGCSEDQGRANAAFIVRAVNNHATLVKALEEIVAAVPPNQGGTQGAIRKCAVAALRAASSLPTHRDELSPAQTEVVRP